MLLSHKKESPATSNNVDKGTVLSEISQTDKDTYDLTYIGILKRKKSLEKNKFIETKNRLVAARGSSGNGWR